MSLGRAAVAGGRARLAADRDARAAPAAARPDAAGPAGRAGRPGRRAALGEPAGEPGLALPAGAGARRRRGPGAVDQVLGAARRDHPAIAPLLEYKELARLHAAHGWAWLDTWVCGGRFRPEYVVGGVVSGRWASRGGGALQIPRVLRRAVVADPGWVLVVADAAQLEPRVLAALAGDRAFAAGRGGRRPVRGAGRRVRRGPGPRPRSRCCPRCTAAPAVRPASCSPCCGSGFPPRPATSRRRRGPGEEGRVVRSVLGRTCPPPSAAGGRSPRKRATPRPSGIPGAGRASRARGPVHQELRRAGERGRLGAGAAGHPARRLALAQDPGRPRRAGAGPRRPPTWCSSSTTR